MFVGRDKKETYDEEESNEEIYDLVLENKEILLHQSEGFIDEDDDFLFGISLHLGTCSNNYTEYMGLIIGQLFCSLLGEINPTFKSDSQLLVQQVKGNYKVKNIRLIQLIKIVHSMAFRF